MSDKNYHRIIGEQFPLPSVTYTNCDSCDRLRVLCGELWEFIKVIRVEANYQSVNKKCNDLEQRLKDEGVI